MALRPVLIVLIRFCSISELRRGYVEERRKGIVLRLRLACPADAGQPPSSTRTVQYYGFDTSRYYS